MSLLTADAIIELEEKGVCWGHRVGDSGRNQDGQRLFQKKLEKVRARKSQSRDKEHLWNILRSNVCK